MASLLSTAKRDREPRRRQRLAPAFPGPPRVPPAPPGARQVRAGPGARPRGGRGLCAAAARSPAGVTAHPGPGGGHGIWGGNGTGRGHTGPGGRRLQGWSHRGRGGVGRGHLSAALPQGRKLEKCLNNVWGGCVCATQESLAPLRAWGGGGAGQPPPACWCSGARRRAAGQSLSGMENKSLVQDGSGESALACSARWPFTQLVCRPALAAGLITTPREREPPVR